MQIYYLDNSKNLYTHSFELTIVATNGIKAEKVFISSSTGIFLGSESLVCNINFPGTAQTHYNGNRNIVTDANTASGPFRLQETRSAVSIRTRNNNNQFLEVSGATDFLDNDNNWTFAEHGNDRAAFDAHWGAETVFDYWLTVHNRNSINNAGMPIESFVHVGTNYFNALWFEDKIYFGDGVGGSNSLTSLDICAHEFGHGIDTYTGDLAYERESGALDEGFADIWGACVEAWATPLKQRWLLGEDVLGGPLRSMSAPNLYQQPDTYRGTNWKNTNCSPDRFNDFCGVHTNSGVLNYWFYLISDGGNGTNDIGNAFNVNGLGINVAAQIAYRTKLLMNNSFANFALCRQVSIQAAIQLFGNCSNEVVQVVNAWYAVGVGSAWVIPNYYLFNPTYGFDCNSAIFTGNFPANSVVTWTTTNGLLIDGNSSPYTIQSNDVTISSPSGSGGSVSASFGGCNVSPGLFCPCEPWENPAITVVHGAPTNCQPLQAYVSPEFPSAYKYLWYINGQLIEETFNPSLSTYNWLCSPDDNGLSVIAVSSCGPTALVSGGNYSPICNGYKTSSNVSVFPNPATSQVMVKLVNTNNKSIGEKNFKNEKILSSISQIRIIDKMGRTRKVERFPKGNMTVTLDISGLPTDIYYLDISEGTKQVRKPLIISR